MMHCWRTKKKGFIICGCEECLQKEKPQPRGRKMDEEACIYVGKWHDKQTCGEEKRADTCGLGLEVITTWNRNDDRATDLWRVPTYEEISRATMYNFIIFLHKKNTKVLLAICSGREKVVFRDRRYPCIRGSREGIWERRIKVLLLPHRYMGSMQVQN